MEVLHSDIQTTDLPHDMNDGPEIPRCRFPNDTLCDHFGPEREHLSNRPCSDPEAPRGPTVHPSSQLDRLLRHLARIRGTGGPQARSLHHIAKRTDLIDRNFHYIPFFRKTGGVLRDPSPAGIPALHATRPSSNSAAAWSAEKSRSRPRRTCSVTAATPTGVSRRPCRGLL